MTIAPRAVDISIPKILSKLIDPHLIQSRPAGRGAVTEVTRGLDIFSRAENSAGVFGTTTGSQNFRLRLDVGSTQSKLQSIVCGNTTQTLNSSRREE